MVGIAKEIVVLMCVPILLVVAWIQWTRSDPTNLPSWRNGLALAALVILSFTSVFALVLDTPILLHADASRLTDVQRAVYLVFHPVELGAILLAIALKGRVRLEAIFAGVLMLVCWPGGYV